MNDFIYYNILKTKLPSIDNDEVISLIENNSKVIRIKKNDKLIKFQERNKKIYFIVEGSFIRNLITSRGETKTIMFHTETFQEFFKSYDTIYLHRKTDYELIANENSVIIEFDYLFLYSEIIIKNKELTLFFIEKTEERLLHLDNFRNFQLGLTSEEYLKWLYENYPFIFQRFTSQNIASFMGITNVWLSNLKAKLTF